MGTWSGTLEAGGGLRIVFHIEQGEDGLTATMDSPDQGATGVPVSDVTAVGDSVTLAVDRILGTYEGALVEGSTKIKGQWMQGGQSFPLTLTPAGPPSRPQHPEPPYPYVADSVTVRNESAGLALAGTLTRPEGEGPHPAVVLVSGSGPQNRNSEVANHKLFLVLADHLTRQGIAVLRCDERGVGESEGTFEGATSADFAGDVAAAVRFLKDHPSIHSGKVGLVGMSEGGLVAPMVHTQKEPVAFLMLMAGPSVPGSEILVEQSAKLAAAQGAPPSVVDSVRSSQQRLMAAVRAASDSGAIAEDASDAQKTGRPRRAAPVADREGDESLVSVLRAARPGPDAAGSRRARPGALWTQRSPGAARPERGSDANGPRREPERRRHGARAGRAQPSVPARRHRPPDPVRADRHDDGAAGLTGGVVVDSATDRDGLTADGG